MAQRYGRLPSEIMAQASTFDMVIMDMSLTYEKHRMDSQKPGYVPEVSTEELLKIKERAG